MDLVTPLNCLRKISKAKHIAFAGRNLRYLKIPKAGKLGIEWSRRLEKLTAQRFLELPTILSAWESATRGKLGGRRLDRTTSTSLTGKAQKHRWVSSPTQSCHKAPLNKVNKKQNIAPLWLRTQVGAPALLPAMTRCKLLNEQTWGLKGYAWDAPGL